MIKRLLLIALFGVFVLGCKTKHNVTYGKGNTTAEVKSTKQPTYQNPVKQGAYALPEDDGKFMRYEVNSIEAYIEWFSEPAQLEMKAYGIPASITLAQGLLESGLGKGELAIKSNNHFGIKCHNGWTGDYVLHDDDAKGECFRKYNHPRYSYRDHSIFLSSRSRYASLFQLDTDDYKGWAKGLQRAGYATDKKYPEKLISLIERYELQQFDDVIVDANARPDAPSDVSWAPTKNSESYKETTTAKKIKESSKSVTHTVIKGDSLWALSQRYGVSVSQLRNWNNMSTNNLSVGQKLMVKKN